MDAKLLKTYLEAYPARAMTDTEGNDTGIILTMPCRVQWPNLAEPQKMTGQGEGTATYSVALIIPTEADIAVLDKAWKAAAVAKFKMPKAKSVKSPLRLQSEKEMYEGFGESGYWITTSTQFNNFGPFGVGGKGDKIDPKEVYAGCWAIAKLFPYAYSFNGNDGVKFGLRGLQKIADDERLKTGGSDPGDGFEAVAGAGKKANGAVTGATDSDW
jgi:hypothetical protein